MKFTHPNTFTSPGLDFTSPGLVFTSPGLVFTSPGVVRASPGVVRAFTSFTSVALMYSLLRAHIYVFNYPKKTFTPSHQVCISLIFSDFKCEGLGFQMFTQPEIDCEWLKSQAFTLKSLKIREKEPPCEGVNAFLRKYLRIGAMVRLGQSDNFYREL